MSEHIKVNDIPPWEQYVGTGAETVFSYPFPIFDADDLDVFIGSDLQESGYTVSGVGQDAGGDVTFDVAPTDGALVTLVRNMAIERTTDFIQSGTLSAKTLNDEFDRIVMMAQQINRLVARALQYAATVPDEVSALLPTPVARRALIFNAAATALELTAYDPDATVDLAAQAASDASMAEAAAAAAQAAAELAAQIAAATGAVSLEYDPVILQDGVDEYLLSFDAPTEKHVDVSIEGANLSPDGTDYTITDTLGVGRTLKLTAGVATLPSEGEWAAGLKMDVRARASGLKSTDISPRSITGGMMALATIKGENIAPDTLGPTTLADSGAAAGTYVRPQVTVNAKGLITAIASPGLITGADVAPNSLGSGSLTETGIAAGAYSRPTVQVDAAGRITTIASTPYIEWWGSDWRSIGKQYYTHNLSSAEPSEVWVDFYCNLVDGGWPAGRILVFAGSHPGYTNNTADNPMTAATRHGFVVNYLPPSGIELTFGDGGLYFFTPSGGYFDVTESRWLVRVRAMNWR